MSELASESFNTGRPRAAGPSLRGEVGGQGFQVEPELLAERIATLTRLGDLTGDLVATASRLAERLPMLGTAPPAVHLALRLREAAGRSGLTGEVEAAQHEVESFHRTLTDARDSYAERDLDAESSVRAAERS